MKKKWICAAILLIALPLLAGCDQGGAAQTNDDGTVSIRLADTNGMDFSFDEEDIGPIAETTVITAVTEITVITPETTDAEKTDAKPSVPAKTTAAATAVTDATTTTAAQKAETTTSAIPATTTATTAETTAATSATEPAVSDGILRITSGGTYTLSGNKKNTMILVNAGDSDVQLILDGITVQNSEGPALYIQSADKVTVTLKAGTVNMFSDGTSYSITDGGSALDAAIFSRADLTVNGTGTLVVNGNYKHGIVSKDDLIVSSGTLQITANNVGLNGKDCVKINSGDITIHAGSDGIRSDNDEDATRGYIYLHGGSINITAANDGIQAETILKIDNVDLTVKAGGGSNTKITSSDESYKGLKAGLDILISGGTFNLDTRDDCIHSNGTVTLSGGNYTLSSGDDGVHADTDVSVSGDSTVLTITKSYEGIEGSTVVISGGDISITASDDGLNAAGGNDFSAVGGRPGFGSFTSSKGKIVISGGTVHIKASGDGIDANGSVEITGGTIMVSGPNNGDTSILDFDTTGTISGGTFIGTGASSMAQNFSNSSTQCVIMMKVGSQIAGSTVSLKDATGNVLLSCEAELAFSCVILSSPEIKRGETYTLTAGTYTAQVSMTSTVYSSSGGRNNMGGGGGKRY